MGNFIKKNIIRKVVNRLRRYYQQVITILSFRKRRLSSCSIICNNCIGGFIYSDLQLKFNSPTINLQIKPSDFLKFIANLNEYLSYNVEEVASPPIEEFQKLGGETIDFPVGRIGDILIFFQHYQSFDFAKAKWNERKQRINHKRLYFILVDTGCSCDEIKAFFALPGKKLFITANPTAAAIAPDETVFMKTKPNDKSWFENDPDDELNRPYYKIIDYEAWLLQKASIRGLRKS